MLLSTNICLLFTLSIVGLNTVESAKQPGVIPCDTEGWVHECEDGSCIYDANLCNGFADCPDGSDEQPYENATSYEEGFECTSKNNSEIKCFLPMKYVCDQFAHCTNDECNCSHQGPFRCSATECIDSDYFCDGTAECSNERDELPFRTNEDGIKCWTHFSEGKACGLPEEYRCDGKKHCSQGGDECFCRSLEDGGYDSSSFFDQTCFRCLDGLGEMLSTQVCNGFIACSDLSDECLCPDPISICNQLAYEENCEFRCREGREEYNGTDCIHKTQICDGKRDCFYGEDEKFCQRVAIVKTDILYDYYEDMPEFWCCNAGYPADCLSDISYTNETHDGCDQFYRCPKDSHYLESLKYGIKCDGNPSCTGSYDECENCSNGNFYCNENNKYGFECPNSEVPTPFLHNSLCDGVADCNGTAPMDSYDELDCPGRHYCSAMINGQKHVSIDNSMVCDCIMHCDDGSDEANCTTYSKFCCRNGKEAVGKTEVCNGIDDCMDGSDECQSCIVSPFADDENLISNKALRAFVWIIGICSSLGNLYVFIFTLLNIYRGSQKEFGKIISFHVAALSVADFCVGVYLLCLGAVSARYSGNYCHEDKAWRSGNTCNFLGVLSMFGTQASVFMLTLMTLNRLHIVCRPFKHPNVRRPVILIILFMLLGLAIAFVPVIRVFEDYFTSYVRIRRNPFVPRDIDRTQFSIFANKLASHRSKSHDFRAILGEKQAIYPWKKLFSVMRHLNDSFQPEYESGFYSSHGVCLPKLFPVLTDPSWQYSMSLIAINFTSFFIIFISYIALYRKTQKTRENAGKCGAVHSEQSLAIQKKITRIIATDFFCWIPICVIAFLKIAGVSVSDEVYAIAAIVILPINSAINPFLYSNLPEAIWSKAEKAYNFTKSDTAKSVETDNTGVEMQRVSTKKKARKGSNR